MTLVNKPMNFLNNRYWLVALVILLSLILVIDLSPEPATAQDETSFPDPNLERVIRAPDTDTGKEAITSPSITTADLESITSLSGVGKNITDLTGLEYCINLRYLNLGYNNISDLSPLANLTKLETLRLQSNNVEDISPLANLTRLRNLNLQENDISDISPLANLKELYVLNLTRNNIEDISALSGLLKLNTILIDGNRIADISPLVENLNISSREFIGLNSNPLNQEAYEKHIPELQKKVRVVFYDKPQKATETPADDAVSPQPSIPVYLWWIIGAAVISAIIFLVFRYKRHKAA